MGSPSRAARSKRIDLSTQVLVAGLLVALGLLAGCRGEEAESPPRKVSDADVRRAAQKAAGAATAASEQARREFQEQLEQGLLGAEVEIAKLREQGRTLKDGAKETWERKLVQLEAKRDVAYVKCEEFKRANAEAWEDMAQSARTAWEDIDQALKQAAQEF